MNNWLKTIFAASALFMTAAANAQYQHAWSRFFNGPLGQSDSSVTTTLDGEGGIYTAGTVNGTGTAADFAVVKYDPFGAQLWQQTFDGLGHGQDIAMDLVVKGGYVYLVGRVTQPTNWYADSDLCLIKYRASDGALIWSKTYSGIFTPGIESSVDEARAVAVDSVGNIIVTGHTWQWEYYFPNGDFRTLKFDISGNVVWDKRYHGGATYIGFSDQAYLVTVDQDDNVLISGDSPGPNNASSWATIKYRGSDGQELWVARSADIPGMSGVPRSLHIAQDGDPIVIGNTFNDYIGVIRYDKDTGSPIWSWNQRPGHMGLEGAGQIDTNDDVVLGVTWDPDFDDSNFNNNTRVIRLNGQTGAEMWRRDYGNSVYRDFQAVRCLNIRPDGRIIVAGHGPDASLNSRLLLLQYSSTGIQEWVYTHVSESLTFESRQVNFDAFQSMIIGGHPTTGTNSYDLGVIKFAHLEEFGIPIQLAVQNGILMVGGLSELSRSDNRHMIILGDEMLGGPDFEVESRPTGGAVSQLQYAIESRATRTDMSVIVQAKNWSTGQFETIDTFAPSIMDVTHQSSIQNPGRFLNPTTRAVRFRVTCVPWSEASAIDGWTLATDKLYGVFQH